MTRLATTGTDDALLGQVAGATGRLALAATPTFALMAGISAISPSDMAICSAASPWAPFNDMALMYLLMSLFHLSPWLKVLSRRRHQANQTEGD